MSSWRDNKKPGGGYSRGGGRGYRPNRGGGNSRQRTLGNEDDDGGHRKHSGYRGRGGGDRGRHYKRSPANHSYNAKRTKYEVGKRLTEEDVGVTEFIGSHKRFAGILKERFSDFHVHEISCSGEICKLTNQDIPPEPQELEDMDKLKESVPTDVREKLEAFAKLDSDESIIEIDVTEMEKELRRNIHIIAKKIPSAVSETVIRDDKKIIVLAKRSKQMGHKFRGDRRVDWSSREGNYCHFLLHKVNMDTMDALNQLAIRLRIKSDVFHYAGTKDRRARTTQWVSLKKVSPSTIHEAAKQVRGAHVGNFKFSKDPLKLGMLKGNRFRIALRSIDATDEEIERAMISLRDNGFINYYGLQRFGTIADIPTHEIGKALLQGKWENAIGLILKPRVGEQQRDMIEARDIYQRTKNAILALEPIARSGKIEAKLLHGIVNCGETNPQGALDYVPRNARLMYIHAYQSFVWNHIVSRRFKEFGSEPIVGDLVYDKSNAMDITESETMDYGLRNDDQKEPKVGKSEEIMAKTTTSDLQEKGVKDGNVQFVEKEGIDKMTDIPVDEISEIMVSKDENEGKTQALKTIDMKNETLDDSKDDSNLPAVKPLTKEDLTYYTIADVVIPKPGWKVTYPSYAKPWFDEFLAKDELTTDLRQKNKKYSLGGAYRKILETPGDLSWKIARYSGYHDDLILCDVDEMRGLDSRKDETVGKYKALIVEFSLKSSTYATMALREILEYDTSAHTQAAQSAANQAQDSLDKPEKMETNGGSVGEGAEVISEENNENIELSENAMNKNTDGATLNETNGHTTEPAIFKETDDLQLPKNIAKANDNEMEVVKDEAKIPNVDERHKMETSTTEPSDIPDKAEHSA